MLDLERRQDILGITVFRDAENDDHLSGPPKRKDRNTRSYSYRVRGVPLAGSETASPVTSSESDLLLIRPPVAG
jgi:hypothetical protein